MDRKRERERGTRGDSEEKKRHERGEIGEGERGGWEKLI